MDTEQHEIKLTIRLPVEIAEMMRRLAKVHDRSLNGEIVRALRAYGEQREQREQER
jgi:predicted transcriptional regulator